MVRIAMAYQKQPCHINDFGNWQQYSLERYYKFKSCFISELFGIFNREERKCVCVFVCVCMCVLESFKADRLKFISLEHAKKSKFSSNIHLTYINKLC